MNYAEAKKVGLGVRWKVEMCSQGEACWCRGIIPETPITYTDGDFEEELYIVGTGELDIDTAEHIVRLHNQSLN
jgi:hypothetical protein